MLAPLIAALAALLAPPPIVLGPGAGKPEPLVLGPAPTRMPDRAADRRPADPVIPITADMATVPIMPAKPWQSMDEGWRCTAERTFGPGPGQVAFKFGRTAFPTGSYYDYLVLRGIDRPRKVGQVVLAFDNDVPAAAFHADLVPTVKRDIVLLRMYATDGEFWSSFRRAGRMSIAIGERIVATVAIPGSAAVSRAAEACATKQFVAFGGTARQAAAMLDGDEAERAAFKWGFAASPQRWFNSDDYPAAARDKGISGQTVVAFTIGGDGRAHDCRAIMSSRNLALDQAGCAVLEKRAAFNRPADERTATGPLVGALRIAWALPNDAMSISNSIIGDFIGAGQPLGNVN